MWLIRGLARSLRHGGLLWKRAVEAVEKGRPSGHKSVFSVGTLDSPRANRTDLAAQRHQSQSAAGDDDGAEIVVENAGDQTNAITLPPTAQVGQTVDNTFGLVMDLGVDGGGMSSEIAMGLEMAMTSEVTEVTADGGYVALTTLEHAVGVRGRGHLDEHRHGHRRVVRGTEVVIR